MVTSTKDVQQARFHVSQKVEVVVILMLNLFHWSISIFQQNPKEYFAFLPPWHISQYLGNRIVCYGMAVNATVW